jgi:plasmid stability protein
MIAARFGGNKIRLTDLLRLQAFNFFCGECPKFMANRKGVFIGAYVPNELKESLRRRAAAEHRTLSQEITRILVEAVHGKGLPTGSVDRRNTTTVPRRRTTDPLPRRRTEDLPFLASDGKKK